MPNYQCGKIYKIEAQNEDEGDIYIGSTTKNTLAERMTRHRSSYKRWKNGETNYVTSFKLFDKYGIENCKIYLIENFPCNTKDELKSREGHFIKSMTCVNRCIAGQTQKEYREKYNAKFMPIILQKQREAYDDVAKAKKKAYVEAHKEEISQKQKEFVQKNYDKIYEKHICECGGSYSINSRSKHFKTGLHKKYIEQKENEI